MNKKSILVFALAITMVGSSTAAVYASQSSVNATKNKVVTVANNYEAENGGNTVVQGKISDEEAVTIATKAMKDLMGINANYFGEAHVTRSNEKDDMEFFKNLYPEKDAQVLQENLQKPTADVIDVQFISADDLKSPMPSRDLVVINEASGEIVSITAMKNLDQSLTGTIDDNRVKTGVTDFLSNLHEKVQDNTLKVSKTMTSGTMNVIGKLADGRDVTMSLNGKDYSVMSYAVNYNNLITLPSVEKDYQDNYRNVQVK
ncbi:hypothetical protein DEAC_c20010 [Desulfosporosinus acididurans]|uniref:Uncharacterized protein n=1 Tax=Desulfosporosinus acididurans TaxID=476652 RepID=A0A0J1FRN5_9FIRM|nr:hypothetical protein [Desulfosporosinus acididurans]KLU65962.1 hypothetical protein DEAC_c20010 [Desulfosporosinus acididurans]